MRLVFTNMEFQFVTPYTIKISALFSFTDRNLTFNFYGAGIDSPDLYDKHKEVIEQVLQKVIGYGPYDEKNRKKSKITVTFPLSINLLIILKKLNFIRNKYLPKEADFICFFLIPPFFI